MKRKKKSFDLLDTIAHLFHPRRSNNHRSKILHPEALFYFSLIVIGIFSLIQSLKFFPEFKDNVLGFSSDITTDKVVQKTNLEREKQGLSSLVYNEKLSQAALAKAQDMFSDQYWAHTAPDGLEPWDFISDVGYVYKVAGENLARDFETTDQMVKAWMNSPTHRANIMNGKFQEIGIAVIDGKLQGFETTLVVQMFGTAGTDVTQLTEKHKKSGIIPTKNMENIDSILLDKPAVLAGAFPERIFSEHSPIFSPLHLTKALFLAIIILIIMTLFYDSIVATHKNIDRMVGKNFAHIIFFSVIAFLLIFFKGGMVQ